MPFGYRDKHTYFHYSFLWKKKTIILVASWSRKGFENMTENILCKSSGRKIFHLIVFRIAATCILLAFVLNFAFESLLSICFSNNLERAVQTA